MAKSNLTTDPHKLVGQLQAARIQLTRAEGRLEGAREQARLAKRRRKEAKQAARRARKEVKRAKAELAEAEMALVEAQARLARSGKGTTRTVKVAKTGKPRALAQSGKRKKVPPASGQELGWSAPSGTELPAGSTEPVAAANQGIVKGP